MVCRVTGLYRIAAQTQWDNADWGHHASADYASVRLYTKVNIAALELLSSQPTAGYDDSTKHEAPITSGNRLFQLTAGDTVRIYAEHTDTADTPHNLVVNGALCRLEISNEDH